MVAWSDVLLWRAAHIETVQDDASAARKAAREQVQELEAHYNRIASQGLAIDAMRQALSRVQDELDHAVNAISAISAYMLACAEAIDGVRVVEAKVRSALEISEEIGCTIRDDGSVSIPYIDLSDAVRFEKMAVLQGKYYDLQMCIADALSIARKVDEELRRKLQELAEDRFEQNGPKEGRHSASPGLPDDADESWSPSEVSAWWGALTDEERQACIERDPLKYGNLDGIDMASRDKANRLALYGCEDADGNHVLGTGLLDQAQAKFDQAQAAYDDCVGAHGLFSDEAMALKAERDRAGRDLADLQNLDERLRKGAGEDGEPVSLLALDTSGEQVKAAVAVGDVDHAQHVANFTPGMGTNVRDSLDNYVDVADRMRDNTVEQANIEPSDVAVVAWLNYDAPTDITKTWDTDVASTEKARAGADRLAGFLTGVRSWRDEQGGSLHLTSVSHSYGSTTAGFAMRQMGEGVVDDHIYLASPGSAAYTVGALGVDPSHVWVSAVPEGDMVQGMGPDVTFGRNPEQLEGIQHLSGDATGAQGYDPQPSSPVANHSSYFAPPKPGERNEAFDDVCRVLGGAK